MTGTSAYLSLLDDWDILEPALQSVIDRVDEIVVVDGAYGWMRPYFDKKGRDPSRSVPQVYDALARLGPKIRVINGIWENEVEKRIAGYGACNARYRYRVDADEIFFFDEAALARFFESDYAVGQMDMPVYVAPGFVSGKAGKPLPRQAFLFDAEKISAIDHLAYLWLILPDWEREKYGMPQTAMIFPESLAFNAHLTHWRPPSSSLARARFYIMNYMRQFGGAPGATDSPAQPVTDFGPVFERITPAEFDEILLGKLITVIPAAEQLACRETPLTLAQEQQFSPIYDQFLASLGASNLALQEGWRTVQRGDNYYLDATLPESLPLHGPEHLLLVQYSDTIAAMKIELSTFFLHSEANEKIQLEVRANGNLAVANIPPLPAAPGLLRRIISLAVWTHSGVPVLKFRLPRASLDKNTGDVETPV